MHNAALVFGIWEYFARGLQHPHALVADDELYAFKTAATEPLEEADPTGLVLLSSPRQRPKPHETRPHSRQMPPEWRHFSYSLRPSCGAGKYHLRRHTDTGPPCKRTVPPVLNRTQAFLFSSLTVAGETLLPRRASVMSSTRRTETPARYISMRTSSTLLSRRRYRSMMAVSKDTPLSRGI